MGDPPAADLRITSVRSGRGRGPEASDKQSPWNTVYRGEAEMTRRINTFPGRETGGLSEGTSTLAIGTPADGAWSAGGVCTGRRLDRRSHG
jgi:hypothetical protein